ncbi:LacI family DNA-binding transcriptional regulator [Devosia sp. 1566]|uniref:LacI family DNA-binding transcriptional regulator n=1 Tax=Devosia sp. 1566 TaxID=2499144 RepID=UPI000FD82C9B|nr:LacI family DNA-binding transcriptional regulator [Devosia sp. 1566]
MVKPPVTIKLRDVAAAAGVSQGTASNVFSRPELVRQEVRERVQAVAKELGYGGPSLKGRLLRAGKVNAIGVAAVEPLSYFFEDPWARSLLAEMSEICDRRGAGMALVSAVNREKLAWNIETALVDGFVLLCVEGGHELVALTRKRDLPFVALALGTGDDSIPAIGIDNIAGAARAAQHLVELGHRRFAVLSTELKEGHAGPVGEAEIAAAIYSTSRDRMLGYWQVLDGAGIARADVPVHETRNEPASVRAALVAVFTGATKPTALLCMSDRIAILALDWLRERGLRVPEDVSVVGFDGVPESAAAQPPLTTVQQPLADIAHRAVAAILDGPVERQVVPLSLVVRGSTGAPPP